MIPRLGTIKPAAQLTIVFTAVLFVLTVAFSASLVTDGILMIIYASIIIVQVILLEIRHKDAFTEFASDLVFPVLAVLTIFLSLGSLVHYVNPRDVDSSLIRLDYLMTGGYPTVFFERFIHPLLTELLQLSYTTYYFLPVVLGLVLKAKRQNGAFDRTLFIILLCFYLSYTGYLLFPAIGPRYTMLHLQDRAIDGGLVIADHVHRILNEVEGIKRDAFPSAHTAVALTVLALSFRYARRLFYVFLPFVAGLVVSTIYLRYHYFVDIVGGTILFVLSLKAGDWYYGWWEKRQGPHNRGREEDIGHPEGVS